MIRGKLEAYLGTGDDGRRVVLYDASDLLPKHRSKDYGKRELGSIRSQFIHHSGALRRGDPFDHMRGSARFAVRRRGFPGFAYHTWIPFFDVFDDDGSRVVYRGNQDETRVWHAGAAPNEKAVAHCLQGNLTARDMSEHQFAALPVVLDWFARSLGISPVPTGHFEAGPLGHAKESCPGRAGKAWIRGYRAGRESRRNGSPWA